MACRYFDDCSGRSKLCKLREKWGSETKNETKWVSQSWQTNHYDKIGNQTGYSKKETGLFGGTSISHYDKYGNKKSSSVKKNKWF